MAKIALFTSASGSYPRLGKNSVGHELRKAWPAYDRKEKSREEVRILEDELIKEVIREQEEIGLDTITDGLIRWYCPVSHIAGKLDGVKIGALCHFLDINFHVRKAVVVDLPRWREPILLDEIRFARSVSQKQLKAVLTGPATLLHYTENQSQYSEEQVGEAYIEALAKEIHTLVEDGQRVIQIDDPHLLKNFPHSFYQNAYRVLKNANPKAFLILKLYGFKCADKLEGLISLPVDCLSVDCVADPEILRRLSTSPELLRQKGNWNFGIVNARTKLIENPELLLKLIEPLFEASTEPPRIGIEPSSGLEFIPRRFARAKLKILVSAARIAMLRWGISLSPKSKILLGEE